MSAEPETAAQMNHQDRPDVHNSDADLFGALETRKVETDNEDHHE